MESVVPFERSRFVYEHKCCRDNGEFVSSMILVTGGKKKECKLRWEIKFFCLTDQYETNKIYKLNKIEVKTSDTLLNSVADMKISSDDVVCFEGKLDSKCSSKAQEIKPMRIVGVNSHLKIEVVITYESKSIKQMLVNYNKLVNLEKLNDVTFVFEDVKFVANSELLSAHSPVFKSMFQCDMLEKKNGHVKITDIDAYIFEHLLHYIKYGKLSFIGFYDDWIKLIIAADKYDLKSLVSICEEQLSNYLAIVNVIDVLLTADLVNAKILKAKCKEYIFENKHHVVCTEGYKSFLKSQRMDLLSELFCEI